MPVGTLRAASAKAKRKTQNAKLQTQFQLALRAA